MKMERIDKFRSSLKEDELRVNTGIGIGNQVLVIGYRVTGIGY